MTRKRHHFKSVIENPRATSAIIWFVAFGAMFYLGAMIWFGWEGSISALKALGWHNIFLGALAASSAYLWRFGRWEYVLLCFGYKVPRVRHMAIYFAGMALTATPGKAGETFRSVLLMRNGVSVSRSLAAFLADRASDVLGMCVLATIASWIVNKSFASVWGALFLVLVLGSRVFSYLLLHPFTNTWWIKLSHWFKWLPVKGGQETLESWAKIWKLPRVMLFSGIGMIAYGTQAMVFAWFCKTVGVGLSVAECVVIFVQATLFGAASMVPGGLGAMEGALVFQLVERGVLESQAISLAIAIRLVTFWLAMVLGVASLVFVNKGRSKATDSSLLEGS